MGYRYHRSVRITKHLRVNFSGSGHSVSIGGGPLTLNFGKNGVRATSTNPITHVSYTEKLGSSSRKSSVNASASRTARAFSNGEAEIHMDQNGHIIITDGSGNKITDQTVIRRVKATPQYQAAKENLENKRQQLLQKELEDSEINNNRFLKIGTKSVVVASAYAFKKQIESLKPETYQIPPYQISKPNEEEIRSHLEEEAKENVKASIFTRKKARKEYVESKLPQTLSDAVREWENSQEEYYKEQTEIKKETDAKNYEDYQQYKEYFEKLIQGDKNAIQQAFESWIESISLPVEINIDYEWDLTSKTMMLDVDLPEIEDLPQNKLVKKSNGNLQEKKKTQAELRGEYARVVFGLAMYISSNVFNLSPTIQNITISGYTQRRDKEGNMRDDYIYSIKFTRDKFENQSISSSDPQSFCMSFENRCNMTKTSLFKAITPFEAN